MSSVSIHLGEVLKQKGMKLSDLAERTGITMANLSIIKTGKARAIRFSTLSIICAVLECQPGDILKFNE